MENKTKAETYIGFAMRAGKFRIGSNAVLTLKRINLLIVCKSASDNTKKEAEKIASKYSCPLLITKDRELTEMTHRENSKVMAICDSELAKAIIDNADIDFISKF